MAAATMHEQGRLVDPLDITYEKQQRERQQERRAQDPVPKIIADELKFWNDNKHITGSEDRIKALKSMRPNENYEAD